MYCLVEFSHLLLQFVLFFNPVQCFGTEILNSP